ncbi:hypothetical protein Hanom_Chr11g00981571 [Helianthus anomalus]
MCCACVCSFGYNNNLGGICFLFKCKVLCESSQGVRSFVQILVGAMGKYIFAGYKRLFGG